MATYYLKQGNQAPSISATLKQPDGTVEDLSGAATVHVKVKRLGAATLLVDALATIDNAAGGEVSYKLDETETALWGLYLIEWVVDQGTVTEETYPNCGYDDIYVEREL